MSSPVEECNRVVKHVIDSGAFDEVRKSVLEELKTNGTLREYVHELVEKSKTLSEGGAGSSKQPKDRKKVLEDLQAELKEKLTERASRIVWDILANTEGSVSKDLENKVHEALCKMYEEREKQQQEAQAAAATANSTRQVAAAAVEASGQQPQAASLAPRPGGGVLTASLCPAGQVPREQQQQQPGNRPPPRHYGLYGQS